MKDPRARCTPSALRSVLASTCALALFVLPAHALGQSDAGESQFQRIRGLIDAGRYADAESAAEAFVSGARSGPRGLADVDRASAVLIEALVRNGKRADARTRALAEAAVRA